MPSVFIVVRGRVVMRLSRRSLLIGVSASALAGCQAPIAEGIIISLRSLLYTDFSALVQKIPEFIAGGIVGNTSFEALKSVFYKLPGHSNVEQNEDDQLRNVMDVASSKGFDAGKAAQLARIFGGEVVIKNIESGYDILVQESKDVDQIPANVFIVEVNNRTSSDIGGQFTFEISDEASGKSEGKPFQGHSISVSAGTSRSIVYPIRFNFSRPGIKSINIIDRPRGLDAKTRQANVLPVGVKFIV